MYYRVKILKEFNGLLRLDEIDHCTYKELGYMREAMREIVSQEQQRGDSLQAILQAQAGIMKNQPVETTIPKGTTPLYNMAVPPQV